MFLEERRRQDHYLTQEDLFVLTGGQMWFPPGWTSQLVLEVCYLPGAGTTCSSRQRHDRTKLSVCLKFLFKIFSLGFSFSHHKGCSVLTLRWRWPSKPLCPTFTDYAQIFPDASDLINVFGTEYGWNVGSAWALRIQSGEEWELSKWFVDLLWRSTVSQRPQAGLAHLELVEETCSCLLLLSMCQLVPMFRR